MSTILTQCRELREKIKRIANLVGDAQVASSLESVSKSLESHVVHSNSLVRNLKALKADNVILEGKLPTQTQIAGFQKKIEAVRKRLNDHRTSLKQGNTWANCDEDAKQLLKQLEVGLRAAWANIVTSMIAETSSLSSFRSLDACKPAFQEIDRLNNVLRNKLSVLPTAKADIQEVTEIGKRLKKSVAKLDLGEVPQAIQEFLKQAAAGGASLVALSDEVLEWLRAREDFLKSLKVTAGRP